MRSSLCYDYGENLTVLKGMSNQLCGYAFLKWKFSGSLNYEKFSGAHFFSYIRNFLKFQCIFQYIEIPTYVCTVPPCITNEGPVLSAPTET